MRIKRGYLFRDFYSKEVSHHHLHVAETQIPVETQMLDLWRKIKDFRCALLGGCWLQAAGGLGILCDRFGEDIWLSLVGPEMEVGDAN